MQPYYQIDNISLYQGNCLDVLPQTLPNTVDFVVTDPPYGLSFMEKSWDHEVPGPEYWRAVARVCKPGALMLAFGGTRTSHRLICAIEDAGWEIRDDILRLCAQDARLYDFWGALTPEQRKQFAELVAPGRTLAWLCGQGFPKAADVGKMIDKAKGATPEAAKWTGWANALKPCWESITLAMKPMDGTIVHNALTHGVAGMNIDACRIGENPGYKYNADRNGTTFHGKQGERIKQSAAKKGSQFIESTKGRWPANLLLDEEAAALLDAQSEDAGGASRFFYTAKVSKKERGEGNDHPCVKPLALMEYLLTLLSSPTGGVVLDPFAGSGTTLLAARRLGRTCIGIELEEHNCEIAKARISQAALQIPS